MKTVTIDNITVPIGNERNLLELIRKADIDLPTFCYHSDLSVYGACRLCLVDIEGRGIQASCSMPPEAGLKIKTQTAELREIRKISIELLLANHDYNCPTCSKSLNCQLQDIARRLGVEEIRFKPVLNRREKDLSSPSIARDPNKCVLCGDCVRFCSEIQGIGAIDFAFRGHQTEVMPAFNQPMGEVECVNCGQCAAVCPTGALAPRSEIDEVWGAIHDQKKLVVAQLAPAVRVAIGEAFGNSVTVSTGQIVAAMKRIGFDVVYDTSFSADLTVIEEATEFIGRKTKGEDLPQFTSCCPGWVKFVEQFYPQLLPNLSSCKSPQQMLGALIKHTLPAERAMDPKDVICVSIMPCTAKKFEAKRPEFDREDVGPDVDHVLTTQELARMIEEAGIKIAKLEPESFDMPMGFKTGAGVIFGNSGGVAEAVLRFASEKVTGEKLDKCEFHQVRGEGGLRQTSVNLGNIELKLAVVHGLANAHKVCKDVLAGKAGFDLIEVMACPGGCIGGAGQPVAKEGIAARRQRAKALYDADKTLELHKSQDNRFVTELYDSVLDGEVGGHKAHDLLHTHYSPRRRVTGPEMAFGNGGDKAVNCSVCVGTNCFVKGSQGVLTSVLQHVERHGLEGRVNVAGSFCFEQCQHGPNMKVGEKLIKNVTADAAIKAVDDKVAKKPH